MSNCFSTKILIIVSIVVDNLFAIQCYGDKNPPRELDDRHERGEDFQIARYNHMIIESLSGYLTSVLSSINGYFR